LTGIAALGILALWCRKGLRFVIITVSITLICIPIILTALETFDQAWRYHGLTRYDVYGRFAAWQAGLQIFNQNPWGIGPGQFEIISPTYERRLFFETLILTPSAHNTYLRVLVENGLIGFLILLSALLAVFWDSLKLTVSAKEQGAIANAGWLFSCLGGILAESFVIDTLHWRHFWIIAGLALAYRRLQLQSAN